MGGAEKRGVINIQENVEMLYVWFGFLGKE